MKVTKHILIKGNVQGVMFRHYAKEKATSLKLTGTVRNTEYDVEIVVQGEQENVEKFIEWCRTGPRRAHVEEVSVKDLETIEEYTSFKIVY
jgi:acylphosphatase